MNERQSNYFWGGKMGRFAAFMIKLVLCIGGLWLILFAVFGVVLMVMSHH